MVKNLKADIYGIPGGYETDKEFMITICILYSAIIIVMFINMLKKLSSINSTEPEHLAKVKKDKSRLECIIIMVVSSLCFIGSAVGGKIMYNYYLKKGKDLLLRKTYLLNSVSGYILIPVLLIVAIVVFTVLTNKEIKKLPDTKE